MKMKRVFLKLSGEALAGPRKTAADRRITLKLSQVHSQGSHLIPDKGQSLVFLLLPRFICRNQLVQHLQKGFQAPLGHLIPPKLKFLILSIRNHSPAVP